MGMGQEELLAAALRGDQVALQQLLIENYSRLLDSIRARIPLPLRTSVDGEDILQSTFVQVFRGLSNFRKGNSEAFFAWVRSIAHAQVADAVRKAKRKKRGGDWQRIAGAGTDSAQSFQDLAQLLSDQRRSPSGSAATHEAIVALQIAVAGLPEDQREAVWLRHIENLPLDDVAEAMKRTKDAVRGLLRRGRAALKKSLGNSSAWFSKT